MTQEQAAQLVAGLQAAYGERGKMTREQAAFYVMDLKALDVEEASAAIAGLRMSSPFLPTIADIFGAVVRRRMDSYPDPSLAWQIANDWATGKIKRDAVPMEVRHAVEVIGDPYLIRTTDNTIALRAQFRDAYKDVLARRENMLRRAVEAGGEAGTQDARPLTGGLPELTRGMED